MIQAEQATTIELGTPMVKAIPPRLVEPYLTGQRSVIAGYVYRAQDCSFREPAGYYDALHLSYEGSDFAPSLAELYILRWRALDMSASMVPPPTAGGLAGSIAEFFTLPVPIPVGAEICRIVPGAEEFIARYDGQVWLRPLRGL